MDHTEAGRYWNANADAWTKLSRADDEAVARCPDMQDTQIMPYFLHVRARKPAR